MMTGLCRRLLLISNSSLYGSGYLDHCADSIRDFLSAGSKEAPRRILFVPYAVGDHDQYTYMFGERVGQLGYEVDSVHRDDSPRNAVEQAEAVFIGGGNTFRLLDALYRNDLLAPIRERVKNGMPYIGASAGSNVACPTLKTTNDMPIVEPPSFDALGLVPFNINAHYLDPDPASKHMGETRQLRLEQFHELNDVPVVGLREGAVLRIEAERMELSGVSGAKLFRRGHEPVEYAPNVDLSFLLD